MVLHIYMSGVVADYIWVASQIERADIYRFARNVFLFFAVAVCVAAVLTVGNMTYEVRHDAAVRSAFGPPAEVYAVRIRIMAIFLGGCTALLLMVAGFCNIPLWLNEKRNRKKIVARISEPR